MDCHVVDGSEGTGAVGQAPVAKTLILVQRSDGTLELPDRLTRNHIS